MDAHCYVIYKQLLHKITNISCKYYKVICLSSVSFGTLHYITYITFDFALTATTTSIVLQLSCFTALLDFIRDYLDEPVPER